MHMTSKLLLDPTAHSQLLLRSHIWHWPYQLLAAVQGS